MASSTVDLRPVPIYAPLTKRHVSADFYVHNTLLNVRGVARTLYQRARSRAEDRSSSLLRFLFDLFRKSARTRISREIAPPMGIRCVYDSHFNVECSIFAVLCSRTSNREGVCMTDYGTWVVLAVLISSMVAGVTRAQQLQPNSPLIFVNAVQLLDPHTGSLLSLATVLIEGNKINEVGASPQVHATAPTGVTTRGISIPSASCSLERRPG